MIDISEVKTYLGITWDESETDTEITRIINRAEARIRLNSGIAPTAELTPEEEQLVFDCCRYIYNHAYEDFERNFMSELTGARLFRQVSDYNESEAEHAD